MKLIINNDKTVIKIVHDNGAETAIKINQSCDGNGNNSSKIVMFLSSSVGCVAKCKHCHCTQKNISYNPLTNFEIINNAIESMEVAFNNFGKNNLRISYMGSGENHMQMDFNVFTITDIIVDHLKSKHMINSFLGVDIGSVVLKNTKLGYLTKYFNQTNNTKYPVRFFYSLHGLKNDFRENFLHNTMNPYDVIDYYDMRKIYLHVTLMDGINDNDNDISDLIDYVKTLKKHNIESQVRLLVYNPSGINDDIKPSFKTNDIYQRLTSDNIECKMQISSGADILSACGQFIGQ